MSRNPGRSGDAAGNTAGVPSLRLADVRCLDLTVRRPKRHQGAPGALPDDAVSPDFAPHPGPGVRSMAIATTTPTTGAIAAALLRLPAICLEANLAAYLEVDPAELGPILDAAEASGLCQRWAECPDGPAVVLGAGEVSRLGLVIDPTTGKWVARGRAQQEKSKWRLVSLTDEDRDLMGEVADPAAAEPIDEAIALELATTLLKKRKVRRDATYAPPDVPPPPCRQILGLGRPWPLAPLVRGRPCAGCGSKALAVSEVCLWCLRSGIDARLPKVLPPPRPRPRSDPRLKGGHR
jgi:hypothetical protein